LDLLWIGPNHKRTERSVGLGRQPGVTNPSGARSGGPARVFVVVTGGRLG
jgi:hypothetical protein